MVADAIGARSQMARTYLERHLDEFEKAGRDELVRHALRALRESLPNDKELGTENTSLGVGGVGEVFELLEGEKIRKWLSDAFEKGENGPGADEGPADAGANTTTGAAPSTAEQNERMDVDS